MWEEEGSYILCVDMVVRCGGLALVMAFGV